MRFSLTTILCAFFLISSIKAQYSYNEDLIRPEISKLAESMLSGYVSAKFIGLEGNPSKDFQKFELLCELATTNELVELTNHPKGLIRCYAFIGTLAKDTSGIPIKIYQNHLLDTEKVECSFGCRLIELKVNEFYNIVATSSIDFGNIRTFTKSDFDIIHKPFSESDYKKIRSQAIIDSVNEAYIILAKYKKNQDIELIKQLLKNENNLNWGLRSVIYFPDTAFLPILKTIYKRHDRKNWDSYSFFNLYYKVLVQYHDDWIKKILKRDMNNRFLRQFIVAALQRFPESEYSELKSRKTVKELNTLTGGDLIRLMYLD